METHIPGVAGSQNEPFYDLLHPNQNTNINSNNNSSSGGLIKQMDELGFEKDIVLPSYTSLPIKSSPSQTSDLQANSPRRMPPSPPMSSYSPPIQSSAEYCEPLQTKWEHDRDRFEAVTMAAVERTMKKHGDNLLRALEGISGRLTQLENKTQHLESSVEELKMSVSKSHGEADGRMRMLENLIREVQTGVQILREKQEIAEARSQLSKSQALKNDFSDSTASQQSSNTKSVDPQHQTGFAAPQQPALSFSFPSPPQASLPTPVQNLPVPLLPQQSGASPPYPAPQPQQSVPVQAYVPSPLGPQQVLPAAPSVPNEPSYQSSLHQSSAPPPPPPQPHQYQVPSHMQQVPPSSIQMPAYSQNPQPQQPSSQPVSIPFNQPEVAPSFTQHVPHSQMPTPAPPGNYGPEPPYMPPNYGGSSSHQQPRPVPSPQLPAPQRFIGSQQAYEPSFGRTSSGPLSYPPNYGASLSGPTYGDSQSYATPPFRPPQQDSTPSGGGGHSRLLTAKPLQHSLPVATSVSGSPSASTSSNRVAVDDVVDKVSSMGFSRDQVKAVVRKLTENGQSVDLNVVLDKLMNGGEIQPQKGWFGR